MTDWDRIKSLIESLINELSLSGTTLNVVGIKNWRTTQSQTAGQGPLMLYELNIDCFVQLKPFPAKALSEQLNSTFQQLKK